jgi:hypothetical protein
MEASSSPRSIAPVNVPGRSLDVDQGSAVSTIFSA